MESFIVEFLKLNPKPSDAQVHALAQAVNVDSETLEATIYSMLADRVEAAVSTEDMLTDNYDEATTPADLILMNDGDFRANPGLQEETNNDGPLLDDPAAATEQDALANDGVVINASARLRG